MSSLWPKLRNCTRAFATSSAANSPASSATDKWSSLIRSKDNLFHVYLSKSRDPYLNLSIEHHIYEKSAPDSTILFLYINDPCVVIGRNQNPWLEADLRALRQRKIPLIRRRSGGGTVFHDHGNVNFSVIYPPAQFTRDKYAELVTRALRPYQPRTRVNQRHDIVIDQGELLDPELRPAKNDMHTTDFESSQTRKCSGSAYKLSRWRALHHGTCLINSPNLQSISGLLRSPLQPFVKARGVDSVRSPVANAFPLDEPNAIDFFVSSLVKMFSQEHALQLPALSFSDSSNQTIEIENNNSNVSCGYLGMQLQEADSVKKGVEELKSDSWLWTQTPRFTFSSFPTEEDNRQRPSLPSEISTDTNIHFTSRSAQILSADISASRSTVVDSGSLVDKRIDQFASWKDVLRLQSEQTGTPVSADEQISYIASWLDELFGKSVQ